MPLEGIEIFHRRERVFSVSPFASEGKTEEVKEFTVAERTVNFSVHFRLDYLFGIFFSVLLKHAFRTTNVGILLRSRTDGKLFNLARLRSKTKVSQVLLRDFLFADDAALVAHSYVDLQNLLDDFSNACDDFGLTISLQKTKIMTQGTDASSSLSPSRTMHSKW